jgi:hypothetical protein
MARANAGSGMEGDVRASVLAARAARRPWSPGMRADLPDWRDPAAYSALLRAERAAFAWEWLRRCKDYRRAALNLRGSATSGPDALIWGLHGFEDPRLPVPHARPIWTASRHPWVLAAHARVSGPHNDALDLGNILQFATTVRSGGTEHLLLSNGYRTIRLDVTGAGIASSPVRLSYELSGFRTFERPLLVVQRLLSLASSKRFAPALHPPLQRAGRHILVLRAFDALACGASQAEIAEALLAGSFERHRWRIQSPSLRSRAQRLVRAARSMGDGAFWTLLE